MKQKNIVATLYLKDGHAVRSMTDFTPVDANVSTVPVIQRQWS